MLNGRSVLRNRVIANVFNQMGLIEAWGTGIKRIREEAANYRLRDPEFLEFDDMFRINLYRYTDDANDANRDANDANHDANDTDQFMADEIYVVNVGGYIGSSTKSEIEYAQATGKKVNYLE